MILMILANLSNAIKNSRKRRARVRRLQPETYQVQCDKGHRHIIRFQVEADGVWATCDCPSRVACYHLIHAYNQREYDLSVQAEIKRAAPVSVATRMNTALLMSQPARRPAERLRGIQI